MNVLLCDLPEYRDVSSVTSWKSANHRPAIATLFATWSIQLYVVFNYLTTPLISVHLA